MIFHRFGYFHPDGTAIGPGTLSVEYGGVLPTPGAVRIGDVAALLVPMDDHPDDWLRLEAEYHHSAGGQGHPGGLTHEHSLPHPTLPYVRLPHTFTWAHAPTPAVQARMDEIRAKGDAELIRHFGGLEPR